MIIDDVLCCEDGHAQERSLLRELLPSIARGDLIIDDRNFCTLAFLFALMHLKAYFITRQHGRMPWKPLKGSRFVGRTVTGRVYEQLIELTDPETGETKELRRITVKLKSPTRRWRQGNPPADEPAVAQCRQRRSLNCIASVGHWSKRLMS